MSNTKILLTGFFACLMLVLTLVPTSVAEEDSKWSQSIGYRLWVPEWESGTLDFGRGRMDSLYYHLFYDRLIQLSLMAGVGDGWEIPETKDTDFTTIDERFDLFGQLLIDAGQWAFEESDISFKLGAGFHYFGFEVPNGDKISYSGIPVLASLGIPVSFLNGKKHKVSLSGTGGYYPIVWVDGEFESGSFDNLETDGWLADGALVINIVDYIWVQLGYRVVEMNAFHGEDKELIVSHGGSSDLGSEKFHGPYFQLTVSF